MLTFYLAALDNDEERDLLSDLCERYYALFIKVAFDILKSQEDAEDIVHSTFVTVIDKKEKFLSLKAVDFRNSCVIIIRNKCIDQLRRGKKFINSVELDAGSIAELAADFTDFDEAMITEERYSALRKSLSELEPLNRQILEMMYVKKKSVNQICSELNMTIPQVNGRLARSRERVRSQLERGNNERKYE